MNSIELGEFLADRRMELNITQQFMADKLNVSSSTISKWENGKCMPDICKIDELADVLEISRDELLDCRLDDVKPVDEPEGPVLGPKEKKYIKRMILSVIGLCAIGFLWFVYATDLVFSKYGIYDIFSEQVSNTLCRIPPLCVKITVIWFVVLLVRQLKKIPDIYKKTERIFIALLALIIIWESTFWLVETEADKGIRGTIESVDYDNHIMTIHSVNPDGSTIEVSYPRFLDGILKPDEYEYIVEYAAHPDELPFKLTGIGFIPKLEESDN